MKKITALVLALILALSSCAALAEKCAAADGEKAGIVTTIVEKLRDRKEERDRKAEARKEEREARQEERKEEREARKEERKEEREARKEEREARREARKAARAERAAARKAACEQRKAERKARAEERKQNSRVRKALQKVRDWLRKLFGKDDPIDEPVVKPLLFYGNFYFGMTLREALALPVTYAGDPEVVDNSQCLTLASEDGTSTVYLWFDGLDENAVLSEINELVLSEKDVAEGAAATTEETVNEVYAKIKAECVEAYGAAQAEEESLQVLSHFKKLEETAPSRAEIYVTPDGSVTIIHAVFPFEYGNQNVLILVPVN